MVFHRREFTALVAATSLAAIAAPASGAPPIAYAKEAGAGFDLYLANPNGSGAVKLYSTPAKNSIGVLDMNPAANEVAIVESRATGFKIIGYNSAGVRTSITPFDDGCYVNNLDFHPSDGSLIVIRRCTNPQTVEVRRWANGAFGPAFVSTNGLLDAYSQVRWLGDGTGFLVGYFNAGSGSSIQRRNLSNPNTPTIIWSTSAIVPPPSFDVARCQGGPLANCSKLLYVDQAEGLHELSFTDFGGGSDTLLFTGYNGRYSPDNQRILYRTRVKGGFMLNVTNPAGTVGSKGTYIGMDWRP